METLECIKTRRSTRGFKPDPVPRDVINKILEAVSNTPSYTNTQPWEVVVVSGKKKDELSKVIFELAKAKAPTNPDLPMPKGWRSSSTWSTIISGRKISTSGSSMVGARTAREGFIFITIIALKPPGQTRAPTMAGTKCGGFCATMP